jgi:cell division protein FtsI (penicillin-binding protein 3)
VFSFLLALCWPAKRQFGEANVIVAAMALAFVGLAVRASYVQVFENAFFKRQGEVRFARTLTLPANRGRILDRNGSDFGF